MQALLAQLLRPLTALHEHLGEPTRQTIGYCAVLTLFFASCVWGKVVLFPSKPELEPTTEAREFYSDTTPAHGITAPPKQHASGESKAAAHEEGAEGGEHGEKGDVKKPSRSSRASKKAGAHDEKSDSHAEKKPSSRSRKSAAKKDEPAEH